jgi:hypothetical protein
MHLPRPAAGIANLRLSTAATTSPLFSPSLSFIVVDITQNDQESVFKGKTTRIKITTIYNKERIVFTPRGKTTTVQESIFHTVEVRRSTHGAENIAST